MKKILLAIFLMLSYTSLLAYETDQFTIPEMEIADVGVDISTYIYNQTKIAVEKINSDLKNLPAQIEKNKMVLDTSDAREKPRLFKELTLKINTDSKRLKLIQTKEGIVESVYNEIGGVFTWEDQRDGVFGLPLSIIPFPKNHKDGKLITWVPKRTKNIYAWSGFHRLISPSYFVFCSSMKMFGVYFGVDKLGHMFNQGYEYYKMYHAGMAAGKSSKDSLATVVNWGRASEVGSFGLKVDGVYSNGDLAANYSGYHFYENLLEQTNVGEKIYAPLLIINNDKTVSFNTESEVKPGTLIEPLFSNHLNEALNPSYYEKLVRIMVKKAIIKRCEKVLKFYEISNSDEIKSLTDSMKTWHGDDYGNRSEELLRIDELCF